MNTASNIKWISYFLREVKSSLKNKIKIIIFNANVMYFIII